MLGELSHPRLLRSPFTAYSAETARELAIADKIAVLKRAFGDGTVANYVISKAASVSDLLTTMPEHYAHRQKNHSTTAP